MHPFHKSSFRPHLVMGAERNPMLMLIVICAALAVSSFNMVAYAIAAGLWLSCQGLLIWLARQDPQWFAVFQRSRRYPAYIPPFSTPFRKPARGRWF